MLALAAVLVISAAVVGWTTPLGAIAPALARLARPFRALRLPVDEWIVAIAVALRCLPLLVDEMRTLAAARRLRHRPPDHESHQTRRALVEIVFEPNTPMLQLRVTHLLLGVLLPLQDAGALRGARPEDSFIIRCDEGLNTADDVQNGRLLCEVGVALAAPAEFIYSRLGRTGAAIEVTES